MIKVPVDQIICEIRRRGAKRVLVQAPEGLKTRLSRALPIIANETGAKLILHGETCFGACDLALSDLKLTSCDLLIHLAHAPFKEVGDDVVFINALDDVEISQKVLREVLAISEGKAVGLVASAQYLTLMDKVRRFLEKRKVSVLIGDSSIKFFERGQITGCEFSSAEKVEKDVDLFIVIGGGVFHALGAALKLEKKVLLVDPYRDSLMDVDSLARKKLSLIADRLEKAGKAKCVGVIMGLKEGQIRPNLVEEIEKKLAERGRKVITLAVREISPEKLRYYPDVEAFIQTLCPRISIDDIESYKRPLLSYEQFRILMGERKFEEEYPVVRRLNRENPDEKVLSSMMSLCK